MDGNFYIQLKYITLISVSVLFLLLQNVKKCGVSLWSYKLFLKHPQFQRRLKTLRRNPLRNLRSPSEASAALFIFERVNFLKLQLRVT